MKAAQVRGRERNEEDNLRHVVLREALETLCDPNHKHSPEDRNHETHSLARLKTGAGHHVFIMSTRLGCIV
jgi:hypothetical protein